VQPLAAQATGTAILFGRLVGLRGLSGIAVGWSEIVGTLLSAFVTPANRILSIRREPRTLVVGAEVRHLLARHEDRAMVPAVEDRTVAVPAETRSIDA
jgi:hypothetical protein